ncbi:MAG TPA: AI-2E family transporter [Rhodopila sp.]|nr:AI-2E family transporter [Rhodopila sp.]
MESHVMSTPLTAGRGALVSMQRRLRAPWADSALKLALIGIGAVLVWRLQDVFLLLFFAVLIATVLRGMADKLAAWLHTSPRLMLPIVAILLTAAAFGIGFWIAPRIAGQANDFFTRLTTQLQTLRDQYGNTPVGHALTHRLTNSDGLEKEVSTYAFSIAGSTMTIVGSLFVVVVMSLYLAESARMYLDGAVRLFPPAHRDLVCRVCEEIAHDLRRWLLGQAVDMLTVGGLAAIGLYLVGVPVPFALALLAGLLTIVPYFGTIAAAIPGVLVGLTESWMAALWVIIIFVGCHIIEGYVVSPLVQGRMVRMPPAIIIGSMTVAAALFGPLGIILGTPLAVVALVLVRRVYMEHFLGESPD